jgi:hypothetical protein
MNNERYSTRNRCAICPRLCKSEFLMNKKTTSRVLVMNKENQNQNLCEGYLLKFLIDLQEKVDDQEKIEEHFINSIFDDDDTINQTSCSGLTLMHVNILGGE